MTTISLVGYTSAPAGTSIPPPAGVQPGDFLLVNSGADDATYAAGWTRIADSGASGAQPGYWRIADGSASDTFTHDGSLYRQQMIAFRGINPVTPEWADCGLVASNRNVPGDTADVDAVLVVLSSAASTSAQLGAARTFDAYPADLDHTFAAYDLLPAGASFSTFAAGGLSSHFHVAALLEVLPNVPPNAPQPSAPINSAPVDIAGSVQQSWVFSDPDPGDSQSAYNERHRVVGASSWTTLGWVTSPLRSKTWPGGTFTEDDYEWQVQTKDSYGEESPWSSSAYFTGVAVSTSISITAPAAAEVIAESEYLVTWSTADAQTSYQLKTTSDSAGAVIVYDTGEVVSTAARSALVPFPTNNVARWVWVRIKVGGLWTAWVSVAVSVSYLPPGPVTLIITPQDALRYILVEVANTSPPASTSTLPATLPFTLGSPPGDTEVAFNRIRQRLVGDTGDGEHVGTVLLDGSFAARKVASRKNYEFQAEAHGINGTVTVSDWTS